MILEKTKCYVLRVHDKDRLIASSDNKTRACFFACLFCKIILQNKDIVVTLQCQKIRVKPAALVGKFCSL